MESYSCCAWKRDRLIYTFVYTFVITFMNTFISVLHCHSCTAAESYLTFSTPIVSVHSLYYFHNVASAWCMLLLLCSCTPGETLSIEHLFPDSMQGISCCRSTNMFLKCFPCVHAALAGSIVAHWTRECVHAIFVMLIHCCATGSHLPLCRDKTRRSCATRASL